MVEARPIRLSWWSWRRGADFLLYLLQMKTSVVRSHHTHLIDSTRVSGAHGELVSQPNRVSFEIFAAVEDKTWGQTGGITAFNICPDSHHRSSRHKLGAVVLRLPQKFGLAPHQEVVQSSVRLHVYVDEVSVRPDLQTHKHNANV